MICLKWCAAHSKCLININHCFLHVGWQTLSMCPPNADPAHKWYIWESILSHQQVNGGSEAGGEEANHGGVITITSVGSWNSLHLGTLGDRTGHPTELSHPRGEEAGYLSTNSLSTVGTVPEGINTLGRGTENVR